MKNLVFICIHNSCRSQIAEYFGKKYLGDIYNVYSAGSEIKSEINKDAEELLSSFIMMIFHYLNTLKQLMKYQNLIL